MVGVWESRVYRMSYIYVCIDVIRTPGSKSALPLYDVQLVEPGTLYLRTEYKVGVQGMHTQ